MHLFPSTWVLMHCIPVQGDDGKSFEILIYNSLANKNIADSNYNATKFN